MRCLFLILTGALATGASAGYLPSVGPSPLRFRLPAPPMVLAALPPLAMEDEALPTVRSESATNAIVEAKAAEAGPAPAPTTLVDPVAKAAAPSQVSTNTVERVPEPAGSPPPTGPQQDQPVMSTQMLMQFFRPTPSTSSGQNPGIVLPVNFSPPAAAPPRSSSATFNPK